MLVKLITYANDKTLLKDKLAEIFAPFEGADYTINNDLLMNLGYGHIAAYYTHQGSLQHVSYFNISKTETHSNGNKSVALMKIDEKYVPLMIEPLIIAGALEILGDIVGEHESPIDTLSDDDKATLQGNNPRWFSTETINVLGQEIEHTHGFIEVQ